MGDFEEKCNLLAIILSNRVREAILANDAQYTTWLKYNANGELRVVFIDIFRETFDVYMTSSIEKKVVELSERVVQHLSSHPDINIDRMDTYIRMEMSTMYAWCRELPDRLYASVSPDRYSFIW